MTTLTNLQTGVYERLGVPSTDGQFTSTVITDFLNDALKQIATERDWPWLVSSESRSTVASQSYVNPGESTTAWTGTENVIITVGTDTWPLMARRYDELLDEYQTTTPGQPEAWAVKFERIELRPIPDAVYTLTHIYTKADKVLVSGSDEPFLPSAYSPALCDLATVLCLNRSKEDPRAISALARYERWLRSISDNRRRLRRPGRIRVRAGSWL